MRRALPLVTALLVTAACGVPVAEVATGESPAEMRRGAERDVAWRPGAVCDLAVAEAVGGERPDVRQLVLVVTDAWTSTSARLSVAVRDGSGTWRCQTDRHDAMVGRTGTRPLLQRRSGDGTAPAGVFPLATVTAWDGQQFAMFGNRPDPGVRVPYRSVRREDCWGATPGTPHYNRLIAREGCPGPDDEWLPRFGDVYGHAAVIGANLDPISGDEPGEPAHAAAIFLHRHSYDAAGRPRPTSGCVSLDLEPLVDVLRLLDPALSPHFAIGPAAWLVSS